MMDGWLGDLAQVATYLSVIVLLVLLYMWLEAICASGKRDDVAIWKQHLEHERTQLTARRMVREIREEKELDRMWRISR